MKKCQEKSYLTCELVNLKDYDPEDNIMSEVSPVFYKLKMIRIELELDLYKLYIYE